jgi:hypothetical protein
MTMVVAASDDVGHLAWCGMIGKGGALNHRFTNNGIKELE